MSNKIPPATIEWWPGCCQWRLTAQVRVGYTERVGSTSWRSDCAGLGPGSPTS